MALDQISANAARTFDADVDTTKISDPSLEGKIALGRADFEQIRELVNQLAIHELGSQRSSGRGGVTKGGGAAKGMTASGKSGAGKEGSQKVQKRKSFPVKKGKKDSGSEHEESNGDDDNEDDDDGSEPSEGNEEEDSTYPPKLPTEADQPSKMPGAMYKVDADAPLIRWLDQTNAVLCFPCQQAKVLKPWYKFQIKSAEGTVKRSCDDHPTRLTNSRCPGGFPPREYLVPRRHT